MRTGAHEEGAGMIHCIHRAFVLPRVVVLYCSRCGVCGRCSYDRRHWDKQCHGYLVDIPATVREWLPCGQLNDVLDTHNLVEISVRQTLGLPHYKESQQDRDEVFVKREPFTYLCTECGFMLEREHFIRVSGERVVLVDLSQEIASCSAIRMRRALG